MHETNRRRVLANFAALAGIGGTGIFGLSDRAAAWSFFPGAPEESLTGEPGSVDYGLIYGPVLGERFPVSTIDLTKLKWQFLRQLVEYRSRELPGSIVIDPNAHFLYYVLGENRAVRYGVGVGKQGFEWNGVATINSKQEWPDWYPPKEMIARRPDLRPHLSELQSGLGVAGGPGNPLGARGMYLWQNNKDTLYRIHGTIEPYSIGQSVSSGCIRMINQDAIDLYQRVAVGTEVKVLPSHAPSGIQ